MAVSLPTLLESLGELPPSALQQVALKAKALLSLRGFSNGSTFSKIEDDYLLEGIYHALNAEGLISRDHRMHKRHIPPGFEKHSHEVRVLLESHLAQLKPVERAALGQLAGKCLVKYLKSKGKGVNLQSMLFEVYRIPAAIDRSYPGYLRSGLLSSCWK